MNRILKKLQDFRVVEKRFIASVTEEFDHFSFAILSPEINKIKYKKWREKIGRSFLY